MSKPCDPCNAEMLGTSHIKYDGPNLPCTNIQTCDVLSVAFQKIDEQICELKQAIAQIQARLNS